jgi:hypothetical protein
VRGESFDKEVAEAEAEAPTSRAIIRFASDDQSFSRAAREVRGAKCRSRLLRSANVRAPALEDDATLGARGTPRRYARGRRSPLVKTAPPWRRPDLADESATNAATYRTTTTTTTTSTGTRT